MRNKYLAHSKNRFAAATLIVTFGSVLTACGGGSSPALTTETDLFYRNYGTYASDCIADIAANSSKKVSGVLSAGNPSHSKAVVQYNTFVASTTCAPEAASVVLEVGFDITPLPVGKLVLGTAAHPGAVDANRLEAKVSSIKLSKGAINGKLPGSGTTTIVGYTVTDIGIRFLGGPRDAEGFGTFAYQNVLKKIN